MQKRSKSILKGIFFAVILLLAAAVIYFWPYLRPAPESAAALEAKLAEYRLVADATQNRPKGPREELFALFEEMKPILDEDKGESNWLLGISPKNASCPFFDREKLEKAQPVFQKLEPFDDRLRRILGPGIVFQQDLNYMADLPNMSTLRRPFFAFMAVAILEAERGGAMAAVDRILTVAPIPDALMRTSVILYPMVGIAVYMKMDETIIALLPRLPESGLIRLKESLAARPDAVASLIDAYKADLFSRSDFSGMTWKWWWTYRDKMDFEKWLFPLAKATGYLHRERLMFTYLNSKLLDQYLEWAKQGAKEPPKIMDSIKSEIKYSPISMIAVPNWDALMGKAREQNLRTKTLIDALDSELVLRQTGMRTKLELPYDDMHKIVVNADYGCVVKTAP